MALPPLIRYDIPDPIVTPFVLVASGQSNMQGSADPSEGTHTVGSNIKIWNGSSLISAAYGTYPLNNGSGSGSTNAAVAFANNLRSSGIIPASRPIWIIPNWFSGNSIVNWVGSGTSSTNWSALTSALSGAGVAKINHVMWMQGEADHNSAATGYDSMSTYLAGFATLYSQFVGLSQWDPQTTFSVSELGMWNAMLENSRNDAIRALGNIDNPNIGFVSAAGMVETSLTVASHAHFSGASLETLGFRHFEKFRAMRLGFGANLGNPHDVNGFAMAPRPTLLISSDTTLSFDQVRNGVHIVIGGNCTITLPDASKLNYAAEISVDNASRYTVTLASTNALYLGNNLVTSSGSLVLPNGLMISSILSSGSSWRIINAPVGNWLWYQQSATTGSQTLSIDSMCGSLWQAFGTQFVVPKYNSLTGMAARFENRTTSSSSVAVPTSSGIAVNTSYLGVVYGGAGYAPNDTITLAGGTSTTAGVVTVNTTQVMSATVYAGGSGGSNGTKTVTGTTGTGTPFQASVTVSGGAITAVLSITVAGSYTANPTTPGQEPVTGASLTGAKLNVVMGVLTATPTTAGSYSVLPENPVAQGSTSGSGTGALFDVYFNGVISGPHPKLRQLTYNVNRDRQDVLLEAGAFDWKLHRDTWHRPFISPVNSSALSSGTLTATQMLVGETYQVNSGAAIVLTHAMLVQAGRTGFYSTAGSFQIACKSTDSLMVNGAILTSASPVTVPINTIVYADALGSKQWGLVGVPVTGTAGAGVAVTNANGTITVTGENALGLMRSPATPTVYDDYFDGSDNGNWAWLNQQSATISYPSGFGAMFGTTTSGSTSTYQFIGREQALPGSGDWCFATLVTFSMPIGVANPTVAGGGYVLPGIYLRDSTSGKIIAFSWQTNSNSNSNYPYLELSRIYWNSTTSYNAQSAVSWNLNDQRGATTYAGSANQKTIWLGFRKSGNNLYPMWTDNLAGLNWNFLETLTMTGFTSALDKVGFSEWTLGTAQGASIFHCFRKFTPPA